MRRVIRIDIDKGFNSWEPLAEAIEGVGASRHPDLAGARAEENGRVMNPHAYWLLAQAVCCPAEGQLAPQRVLRGVERAMVEAFAPFGADAGGPRRSVYRQKTPTGHARSCAPNRSTSRTGEVLPGRGSSLWSRQFRPTFDKSADFYRQSRPPPLLGDADTLAILPQSNGLFEVLKRFTFAHVAQFHPRGRGEGGWGEVEHRDRRFRLCTCRHADLARPHSTNLPCRQAAFDGAATNGRLRGLAADGVAHDARGSRCARSSRSARSLWRRQNGSARSSNLSAPIDALWTSAPWWRRSTRATASGPLRRGSRFNPAEASGSIAGCAGDRGMNVSAKIKKRGLATPKNLNLFPFSYNIQTAQEAYSRQRRICL